MGRLERLEAWAATAVEVCGEVKPLADRLPQDRFEVVVEDHERLGAAPQRMLDGAARAAGLRQTIRVCSAPRRPSSSFGLSIERRLSALLRDPGLFDEESADAGAAVIERAAARARDRAPRRVPVATHDGLTLDAFTAGDRARPAVMLIPPCGMPVELSRRWLHALGDEHFVITWQTRGLFSPADPEPGMACDVAAQVGDLLAVMDALGVPSCHLMGLCGGAVIALEAAHRHPGRFGSMSLWHGDYDFGPGTPKTDHQRDVQALMEIGADSPEKAASYQKLMHRPAALATIPERVAPLVIYPYATPTLFHHYARLNLAIMSFDSADPLGRIPHSTLVVTSRTDTTAHPAGSHRVARELARARLVEEPSGDHLSVFDTSARLTRLAAGFLAAQHPTHA
ncbi:alpha/beta hydrolase [Actinomadura sp. KC216]|uniref:alpha/beta fold hydrolase n=1 Tax=Actinomadura sp. KC216 TaxID=2530370 RepID=UPI00104CCC85|nr:alpha/beta hydrolase [Actinomadura sp. KC216]TDB90676.1 alpha/beta hydrolase [Actinomadura sp. KC216]